MLRQIFELASLALERPVSIGGLDARAAGAQSPAAVFDIVQELAARLVRGGVRDPGREPVSVAGAVALFAYLADPPEWLSQAVRQAPAFPPAPHSAVEEARASGYVALAALVQNVWEHALGEESRTNEAMAARIAGFDFTTAFDFGCGAGHYGIALGRAGRRVFAWDVDRLKREFTAFRADQEGVDVRIVGEAPPEPPDAVLAIDVLDHAEAPAETVAAFGRLARPGSLLFLRALFPDDGWHVGGDGIRHAVWSALHQSYRRHEAAPLSPFDALVVMTRRRRRVDWDAARQLPIRVRADIGARPRSGGRGGAAAGAGLPTDASHGEVEGLVALLEEMREGMETEELLRRLQALGLRQRESEVMVRHLLEGLILAPY